MFSPNSKTSCGNMFGKKRTYIGFGAFLLAQTAMLCAFKFTRWQSDMERLLSGNGYLANRIHLRTDRRGGDDHAANHSC
jgi:hypothetical protein